MLTEAAQAKRDHTEWSDLRQLPVFSGWRFHFIRKGIFCD